MRAKIGGDYEFVGQAAKSRPSDAHQRARRPAVDLAPAQER
jgi:hypothetical protein